MENTFDEPGVLGNNACKKQRIVTRANCAHAHLNAKSTRHPRLPHCSINAFGDIVSFVLKPMNVSLPPDSKPFHVR